MIWKNIELFNVEYIEEGESGARVYRFQKETLPTFELDWLDYSKWVSELTTGCEMRFVGEGADIELRAVKDGGTVEIFRGDYLDRVVTVPRLSRIKYDKITDSFGCPFSVQKWRYRALHDTSCRYFLFLFFIILRSMYAPRRRRTEDIRTIYIT